MSEGGLFPWKLQRVEAKPTANYSRQSMTLPPPPKGQQWQQDPQTKEYKLVGAAPGEAVVVDFVAAGQEQEQANDADWDLLSDRTGCKSSSQQQQEQQDIFVVKAGSVRSINTLDFLEDGLNSARGGTAGGTSTSYKIQRTHSNSTIDSNEVSLLDTTTTMTLGPLGKGVLGVDYVEHVVLPTDTLQGICIAYKISTTRLRQANHFSGNSLLLAPKKLVIPLSKTALKSGFIRVQDTDAKEYKLYSFLAEFQNANTATLGMTEAKAYLELADWDLKSAIQSAKEDIEWEREMDGQSDTTTKNHYLKSGQIRITSVGSKSAGARTSAGLTMQGAGLGGFLRTINSNFNCSNNNNTTNLFPTLATAVSQDEEDANEKDNEDKDTNNGGAELTRRRRQDQQQRPVVYAAIPTIATKTVQPVDVYRAAATQHGSYGVELKELHTTQTRQAPQQRQ